MTPSLPILLQLVWLSVRAPRSAARIVLTTDLRRQDRWLALFLFVLIGSILAVVATFLVTGHLAFFLGPVPVSPIMAAIVTISGSVLTVFGIFWIGRAMGGTGRFDDAIMLVAWMQFVVVCLQLTQLAVFILASPLADLVDIAASLVSLWVLTNFVAELHGFRSLGRVFLMIIVSLFGVALGVSMILAAIGFSVTGV